MQRCKQMTSEFYPVASDTNADKVYEVRLWTPGVLPSCTCVGFATKRTKLANQLGGGTPGAGKGLAKGTAAWCKHLTYVEKTVCHWEQKTDADFSFDGTCPKCGGPVVDDNDVSTPTGDAALADLLALRNELAGEPVKVSTVQTVTTASIPAPGPKLSVADAAAALIKEMT
jgi:hypothetical protein